MAEEFLSTGMVHAHAILEKWERLSDVSITYVQKYLNDQEDKNVQNEYISLMLDIWKHLYPKVKDRNDFGDDIKNAFEDFKKFRKNPKSITADEKSVEEFMAMEEHMAIVLEKLKITDFEVGKK